MPSIPGYPMPWEEEMGSELSKQKNISTLTFDYPNLENIKSEILNACAVGKSSMFRLQPHQHLIQMLFSDQYPYRGMLLFYGVGTGKTCTAVQVAETYLDEYENKAKQVIIMSPTEVRRGFQRTIFNVDKLDDPETADNQCTGDT